jgi:hypothetical protein
MLENRESLPHSYPRTKLGLLIPDEIFRIVLMTIVGKTVGHRRDAGDFAGAFGAVKTAR